MTHADLIQACLDFEGENGIEELLTLLTDISISRAQACGLNIQYIDEDDGGDEPVFHTVQ
ncbi:hypothetical protein CO661_14145 [Sinorhizobium fredii]|uniref:Uncharacterized protein n=1 Tax=Rhizobium fredii TaxID=380 RepID=A0A2A6LYW0_RHIFR|nr:hypothetical protein [Sinorhizobium fredii]PDT47319.1 hypothetical protein CO661_14145 [Sinorhizobium fredii]